MVAGMEPNAENKLFVGGCPAGSGEDDLRELFEKHGHVEEVFVMRGGSRSGMACAFVRFATQQQAQAAIDAIHGRITLPNAAEPLVVRWADAPGSRKRDGREGRGKRSGGGGGGGSRDVMGGGMEAWAPQMMMANGLYGAYPPHLMMANLGPQGQLMSQGAMLQQQAAMSGFNGSYGYAQGQPIGAGSYANGGMLPHMSGAGAYPQQQMMVFMEQQQQGLAQQQFWQVQPGSPSPNAQAPMGGGPPMVGGPPMGGAPPGAAANTYGNMRPPETAPVPIAAGPGAAMM